MHRKPILPHRLAFCRAPKKYGNNGVKIRRPGVGETLRAVVLDEQFWGLITHWILGRTKPCFGDLCACRDPEMNTKPLWKGYAMAQCLNDNKLVILEITSEAVWSCPELDNPEVNLRGALVTLTRKGGSNHGRVAATLQLRHTSKPGRPAVELLDALSRVWFGTSHAEQRLAEDWVKLMDRAQREQRFTSADESEVS